MKCYNCKKEIPNDIKFCPACNSPQQFSQELINRAINKESAAEDQLYYMTYNNVFWEIRSMVKDGDVIHDLTQDTYIKAYNNLSQLKEPAAFRGWIKRIGHNLTIDYLRKTKPRVFSDMVSSESDEMLEFPDERTDSMPEAVMDQKETKRLIDEILNSLSDEQRVAVSMFYYQQKSIKEISEELGISENTIKSRLYHGRNKIEVEVRELEKKGTKLYSLAPIPFLLFLFRTVDAQAAELPSEEILQKVKEQYNSGKPETEELQSETVSTEGNAYSNQSGLSGIGTEATKTAIKTASKKGIAIKILAGIVAASVIGGVIAGLIHNRNNGNDEQQNVAEPAGVVGEAGTPETSDGAVAETGTPEVSDVPVAREIELVRAETFEGTYLCEEEKGLYLKVEAIGDYECRLTWLNSLNNDYSIDLVVDPDGRLTLSFTEDGELCHMFVSKDEDSIIITGDDAYYNSSSIKSSTNHFVDTVGDILQNSRYDGTYIKVGEDEMVFTEPDITEFLGTYTKDGDTISLSMSGDGLHYSYRNSQGEESGICDEYSINNGMLRLIIKVNVEDAQYAYGYREAIYQDSFVRNSRENTLTAKLLGIDRIYSFSSGVYQANE